MHLAHVEAEKNIKIAVGINDFIQYFCPYEC